MYKNLGLGVIIKRLSGDENSINALKNSINKKIKKLKLEDNILFFIFYDNTGLTFSDEGQSCCEERYMTTDDDLDYFIDSIFLDAEIKDAPDFEDEYEVHEVQFLEIKTSKGSFVIETHNKHNGYYSGFAIKCSNSILKEEINK